MPRWQLQIWKPQVQSFVWKKYKKLDAHNRKAHNLRVYFGCVNAIKTISLSDFFFNIAAPTQTTSSSIANWNLSRWQRPESTWMVCGPMTMMPLVGFWHGIFESVHDGGATVSYLVQTNTANWQCFEVASTFYTPYDNNHCNIIPV